MAQVVDTKLSDINLLTSLHYANNTTYRHFVESLFSSVEAESLEDVPYLPVTAFKGRRLKSVRNNEIYKVMYSSGTGVGGKSEIVLDRETARLQTDSLVREFGKFFGRSRLHLLVLEQPPSSETFSASNAALSGFSMFSKSVSYALDRNGKLDLRAIEDFILKSKSSRCFLFGFTFEVWRTVNQMRSLGVDFLIEDSFLLHGGGWKKLIAEAVSSAHFAEVIKSTLGVREVHNYYGMVEQTGTIYLGCSAGFLHAPDSGDFLIRDPLTLDVVKSGEPGVIQVFSTLQRSYPGHSLVTEDLGHEVPGLCPCGNLGRRLVVLGRLDRAEVRGCSDAV